MARRTVHGAKRSDTGNLDSHCAVAAVPAVEAFSFLQETRGVSAWTARDMARSLNIPLAEAKKVISLLALQGYVNAHGPTEFMTTLAGEGVSGSKPPRFTRERVQKGLQELRKRISETNRDRGGRYRVTKAVAFGDFLGDRVRLQSAQVGIALERRGKGGGDPANERTEQREFLKQLVGRGVVVHLRSYEGWMSSRTHVALF